jgi:hypothetical protein
VHSAVLGIEPTSKKTNFMLSKNMQLSEGKQENQRGNNAISDHTNENI